MTQPFKCTRCGMEHIGECLDVAELKQHRDELVASVENLVRVKGRHHTEQAYKQLEAALAKVKK